MLSLQRSLMERINDAADPLEICGKLRMPETGRRPTRNVFSQPPKLLNLEPGPSGGLLGDHAADLGTWEG